MPKDYVAVRDACYKKKSKNGTLSNTAKKECQRMASIWYYKKHGKPVQHADANENPDIADIVSLDITIEQLDIFGSLEKHIAWSVDKGDT